MDMSYNDQTVPGVPGVDEIPEAPKTSGSLEQRGIQLFQNNGYDTQDPKVKSAVVTIATQLRQNHPGKSDDEIASIEGPRIMSAFAQQQPQSYRDDMQKIHQQYSPDAEAKLRQDQQDEQALLDIGRNLSLSARLRAGPEANKMLDQDYADSVKRSQQPLADWQAKKQAALQQMEEQIKAGEADAGDLRNRLTRLGLEQALEERKDKQTIARAEADPSSITSESMRQLAKEYAPDMVAQLGDRFNRATAAQLKAMMPSLEKAYLKKIEVEQKKADLADKANDRTSREKVAATQAGATVKAAQIRADATRAAATARAGGAGGQDAQPAEPGKISGLKVDKYGNISLSPDVQKALGPLSKSYEQAIRGLKEIENVLPMVDNASASGIGSAVSGAQRYLGIESDRRKADEALTRFATAMLPTLDSPLMKGAPSEADARRSLAVIQDPQSTTDQKRASINALKVALNDAARDYAGAISQYDKPTRQRLEATGVRAPQSATVRMKDRSGKTYNIPADQVADAKADGLMEAK